MQPIRVVAKPESKIAYLMMRKVASMSIPRTFLPSREELDEHDRMALQIEERKRKLTGWEILISVAGQPEWRGPRDTYTPPLLGISNFYYDEEKKAWSVRGFDSASGNHHLRPLSQAALNEYFFFTFVRNPYRRLVSFFQNFIVYDEEKKIFHTNPQKAMRPFFFKGFSDFIQQVVVMKDEEMDHHLMPQSLFIRELCEVGGKMDFIGKIENVEKDFEGLRQKYNLLSLDRLNDSAEENVLHKNWRDYYTPETAKLVYDRWAEDFSQFAYEMEYPKLLAHFNAPMPLRFRKRQLLAKLGFSAYKKYLAE